MLRKKLDVQIWTLVIWLRLGRQKHIEDISSLKLKVIIQEERIQKEKIQDRAVGSSNI